MRIGSIYDYSIANKSIKVYKLVQTVSNCNNLLISTVDISSVENKFISERIYAFGVYSIFSWFKIDFCSTYYQSKTLVKLQNRRNCHETIVYISLRVKLLQNETGSNHGYLTMTF